MIILLHSLNEVVINNSDWPGGTDLHGCQKSRGLNVYHEEVGAEISGNRRALKWIQLGTEIWPKFEF